MAEYQIVGTKIGVNQRNELEGEFIVKGDTSKFMTDVALAEHQFEVKRIGEFWPRKDVWLVLDDPRVQELVAVVQKAKLILAEYEPYPLPVLHELHTALASITDTGEPTDG